MAEPTKEEPICPKCGSEMYIILHIGRRFWVCKQDNWSEGDNLCDGNMEVDPKQELSMEFIAKSMAVEKLNDLKWKRPSQADPYKATVSLIGCINENPLYLSESEIEKLLAARDILVKFRDAADRSEIEFKNQEVQRKRNNLRVIK